MSIRTALAPLTLALALGLSAPAAAAPPAAPAKFKDVLAAYKGKDVTVSTGKADDAKQRKLVMVGDDFFAVELPDGRRNYFMYTRVGNLQISDGGTATIYLTN